MRKTKILLMLIAAALVIGTTWIYGQQQRRPGSHVWLSAEDYIEIQQLYGFYARDVDPGSTSQYLWETAASVQHELRPGVGLTAGYYRTWYGNHTLIDNQAVTPADFDPYCVTAPVHAQLPGGGGYQICGLYDVKRAKFGQIDNLVTRASNFGGFSQVFNGVDVLINAQFGGGRVLSGGLSTGRFVNDFCNQADAPIQFCRTARPWNSNTEIKLSDVYPLPWWGLQTSATYVNLPGASQSSALTTGGSQTFVSSTRWTCV